MGNFFFLFFALLIAGYAALNLLGLVMGYQLALMVLAMALVALMLSLIISVSGKLDELTAEVRSLRERLGAEAPEETDHEPR